MISKNENKVLQEENQEFEILSCPDCKSEKVKLFKQPGIEYPYKIECGSCGYEADEKTLHDLLNLWNGIDREKIKVKLEIINSEINEE